MASQLKATASAGPGLKAGRRDPAAWADHNVCRRFFLPYSRRIFPRQGIPHPPSFFFLAYSMAWLESCRRMQAHARPRALGPRPCRLAGPSTWSPRHPCRCHLALYAVAGGRRFETHPGGPGCHARDTCSRRLEGDSEAQGPPSSCGSVAAWSCLPPDRMELQHT